MILEGACQIILTVIAHPGGMEMQLSLICRKDNDLYQVLQANHTQCQRYQSLDEAICCLGDDARVMILADDYPKNLVCVDRTVFRIARERNWRLYIEFPGSLPDAELGQPYHTKWERGVVSSDTFAPDLERLRILMIHGCVLVPVHNERIKENTHIVMGRVAGFDTALYDLPLETFPVLFEHPQGDLLVSTTKLSQFVTARYGPTYAWGIIWRWILEWINPEGSIRSLEWTPTVQPAYAAGELLPGNAELGAFQQGIAWFKKAKLFIHPVWKEEARQRMVTHGMAPGPEKDWPLGDGSCGMVEGISSNIHPDGTQDYSYTVRNDCMGEVSMAMAFSSVLLGDETDAAIAANINDFIYFNSEFAGGPRANADSPSYGLLTWTSHDVSGGVYYGDDNARSMLGTMAVSALLKSQRWEESLIRCLLANLRTTGPLGFRSGRLEEPDLQEKGWRYFWNTERVHYAPHYESWLWACFLWAYHHTGFRPFLDRARSAIRMTVNAYPDEWRWTNGMQQERARMLLPLAWLVRIDDTQEHRAWLHFMAGELLAHQHSCGAIQEQLGLEGRGAYAAPKSNEDYGVSEAPLIQSNSDQVCDLLYTSNFALAGLHEAAAATGDRMYVEAEEKLAAFLCRIQVHSKRHLELDGGWFRGFDFKRWEYWGSNADIGWGVWSIESGWTQAWITSVLAMRQLNTSFWDLTETVDVTRFLDELVHLMLPYRNRLEMD